MGNKKARDLSRPRDRGRPCTCDIFDLQVAASDNAFVLSISTDLPAGTKVDVLAQRRFRDETGHEWYWTAIEGAFPLEPHDDGLNRLVLRFSADALDTIGLKKYRHLQRTDKGLKIATIPTAIIEIEVWAPHRPHQFGLCNRRLTGKGVIIRPSGHSVEHAAFVELPFSKSVKKKLKLP
jgi:hypothetical protein